MSLGLNEGYYTALGTPVDIEGRVITSSLISHVEQQIDAKASGLLLMGSMGMQSAVKNSEYAKTVKIAETSVNGRVPLFIGAMDNSIWRVKDRLDALSGLKIDGVVLTTPYYNKTPDDMLINFFKSVADISPSPVYLYDLPVVTKHKITYNIVKEVSKNPNIKGIKTGDIVLVRKIMYEMPEFEVMYSTIDAFDTAVTFGISKVLDGMFSCTPKNASRMASNFWGGNIVEGVKYLNRILDLRDSMCEFGIFPSFTAAMNLLGFEGRFGPDYMGELSSGATEVIKEKLIEIGEL